MIDVRHQISDGQMPDFPPDAVILSAAKDLGTWSKWGRWW